MHRARRSMEMKGLEAKANQTFTCKRSSVWRKGTREHGHEQGVRTTASAMGGQSSHPGCGACGLHERQKRSTRRHEANDGGDKMQASSDGGNGRTDERTDGQTDGRDPTAAGHKRFLEGGKGDNASEPKQASMTDGYVPERGEEEEEGRSAVGC